MGTRDDQRPPQPYGRGGGVKQFPGGGAFPPINVMDGGRDEPLEPMTNRQRWALGIIVALVIAGAIAAIAILR
jgi:hypothetical protein